MRQLTAAILSSLVSLFIGAQAFAFSDRVTVVRVEQLKQTLEAEAPQNRLAHLEGFKDFLFNRLNTIEMPEDILNTPDSDPRMEEFRSLTEFSGYVNLISAKQLSKASCGGIHRDIINTAQTQGTESQASEALAALKILSSLCK